MNALLLAAFLSGGASAPAPAPAPVPAPGSLRAGSARGATPRGRDRARVRRAPVDSERRVRCGEHPEECRGDRAPPSGARRRGASSCAVPGGPPAVYGELPTPGATRTVVLYAHYDGQPVDPPHGRSPPWKPVLRDKALDDGGPEIPASPDGARLDPASGGSTPARRATTRRRSSRCSPRSTRCGRGRRRRSVNLKFFFEGEEEAGSPHLASAPRDARGTPDGRRLAVLRRTRAPDAAHADRLRRARRHGRRAHRLRTRRGRCTAATTATGRRTRSPSSPTCSPRMRDDDGRILIEDFSDDVRPADRGGEAGRRRGARRRLGSLRAELELARTEGENALAERIMLPALNLRGHRGRRGRRRGRPTRSRPRRTASIDFRLVPDQTPGEVRERVEAHLRAAGLRGRPRTPTPRGAAGAPADREDRLGRGLPGDARLDGPARLARRDPRSIEEPLGGPSSRCRRSAAASRCTCSRRFCRRR